MILFTNPGLIDIEAALLMGVNAKIGNNPIGYFGSGLKYAIAVLLRTGHQVIVCRGDEPYHFTVEALETRGKVFHKVLCNGKSLGFTTELGKHWEVWEAFRELHCNAKDEGGATDYLNISDLDSVYLAPNTTSVIAIGPDIDAVWNKKEDFLYLQTPDLKIEIAEVTLRPSHFIFYRGIRVKRETTAFPFTANILSPITLTENRTPKWEWEVNEALARIGDAFAIAGQVDMVKAMIAPKESDSPLQHIRWGGVIGTIEHSQQWVEIARSISKTDYHSMTSHARNAFQHHTRKEDIDVKISSPTAVQQLAFDRAIRICKTIGFEVDEYPIVLADRLGMNILGLAKNGKIYVSMEAFEQGTKQIATTLAEEFIHLRHHHLDESRGMQNFLFNKIFSMAEELMGEAI